MEVQNSSATSDRPIVRRRLDAADVDGLENAEQSERRLDLGSDRLQLGVAPVEAGELGAMAEGVEIDGVCRHGGEDTGSPGARASCSRVASPGMLGRVTRRRVVWLGLALLVTTAVLLAAAAIVLLPRYARQLAVWQLGSLTGRPVAIQALDLSLTTGHFSVRGLRVADRDGGLLAELDRLEGRFHPVALLRLHLWIERLTLGGGHVRIVRLGPGRFNVSDLLDRPAASGRSWLDISVDRFTIDGGWVALEDRMLTPPRTWRSDDIRLDARNVSTLARGGTAFGSTEIAGALVTVRVEDLRLAPVHLRATVNVRDLDLRLPALYLPGNGPLRLERGTLDAGLGLAVDARDGTTLDADAVVTGFALHRRGDQGDAVTAPELRLLIRELQQRPGAVALRYASLGGDVTVLDPATTPRPLTFSDLTVTVSGIEDAAKGSAQLALHANVPGGGEVDVTGAAGLTPRHAELRVRARGLELASITRDLPIAGRLAGVGTSDLRVVARDAGTFSLAVNGDARVDRLSVGDGTRALAGAARVALTGLAYTWPARVTVDRLAISQPSATLERDAAGGLGLAALWRPPPEAEGAGVEARTETSAPSRLAPDVRIARLEIDGGGATLSDAASGARVEVARLAIVASNLTWPGDGAADVTLSASVAGAAVTARGTVDAARRRAEVALGLGGADLALLQPWLPIAAHVRGTLSRADLRITASHDGALTLGVAGDATIERLAVSDGHATPLGVERVTAKGIDSTWPATVRVADLTLTRPALSLERDAAGTLNVMKLARPATPTASNAPAEATPRTAADLGIARLRIDEGRASLSDAAAGTTIRVTRIALTGSDLTWPAQGASHLRLTADVAGGQVTARGTVDAARQQGEIAVTVRGADLATLQPWLPIVGRVQGGAEADVTATVGLARFTLALRGTMGVANLALLDGTRPLLTAARVDAAGVDLQWPASLAIERLHVNTPWAQVDRNPQGELSLRALFRRRADRPAPALAEPVAAGPVPGLELTVRHMLFDNGGLNVVDDAVEPAARLELRGSRLELRNLTWPARGAAAVQLSTPMPGSGTLKAGGTFSIEPTRLQLDAEMDQVDLAPGRPYLPFDARLNGRVSSRLKLTATFGDTVTLVIAGDAAVDRLALGDADRRLATVQRLELIGLRYQYPTTMRLRRVTVQKPWALIERNTDGSLQLVSLIRRRQSPVPPVVPATPVASTPAGRAPAAAGSSARLRVAIEAVALQDGFLRFVDRTTEPDYAEELSDITLTAERLGTNPRRHGTLALRGMLASGNPLTVQGQVGALTGPLFFDLTVALEQFPVPRLNPHLDRLSAWIARQGTLTAALRYRLTGEELDASNDVTLAGLELEPGGRGAEVQRRLGVSLGLLVSLLKDREGNIHLNVPVRGSLTAPDFDYGEAAWAALRNLAIRLVASPFSLIGKVFFTEDSRIETVQVDPALFQTARAVPTPDGARQVEKLATFLAASPGVRLRVRPVTTVADVTALRREALESKLGGADPATRRQAAVALYTELFPRRQPPPDDEALLGELTRETPTPPRALGALATGRVSAVRDALARAGIAAERLAPAESRAAVEGEGTGRVEFEIVR
jgi:uncharacterized protein involved in outer membrane biogenesis